VGETQNERKHFAYSMKTRCINMDTLPTMWNWPAVSMRSTQPSLCCESMRQTDASSTSGSARVQTERAAYACVCVCV
jgi:hypothetical protein